MAARAAPPDKAAPIAIATTRARPHLTRFVVIIHLLVAGTCLR
jgi:hypothetical protein